MRRHTVSGYPPRQASGIGDATRSPSPGRRQALDPSGPQPRQPDDRGTSTPEQLRPLSARGALAASTCETPAQDSADLVSSPVALQDGEADQHLHFTELHDLRIVHYTLRNGATKVARGKILRVPLELDVLRQSFPGTLRTQASTPRSARIAPPLDVVVTPNGLLESIDDRAVAAQQLDARGLWVRIRGFHGEALTAAEDRDRLSGLVIDLLRSEAALDLVPDEGGWLAVQDLIDATADRPLRLTHGAIERTLAGNEDVEFNWDGRYIRATSGHAFNVDLDQPAPYD